MAKSQGTFLQVLIILCGVNVSSFRNFANFSDFKTRVSASEILKLSIVPLVCLTGKNYWIRYSSSKIHQPQATTLISMNKKIQMNTEMNRQTFQKIINETKTTLTYSSKSILATLNWASSDGWIKANVDQIGYYRVNYETKNWKSLYLQLQSDHKVRTNIYIQQAGLGNWLLPIQISNIFIEIYWHF